MILSIKSGDLEIRAAGIVLVAHPEFGMGVEFLQTTGEQQDQVHRMITTLRTNPDKSPELQVEPEGLESSFPDNGFARFQVLSQSNFNFRDFKVNESGSTEDALVDLFRHQFQMPVDTFLRQMREQRQTVDLTLKLTKVPSPSVESPPLLLPVKFWNGIAAIMSAKPQ